MPMLVKFYQCHPENPFHPENPDSDIFTHFYMPMLVKFYQTHPENPFHPENPDSDIFTFLHANVGEILSNPS